MPAPVATLVLVLQYGHNLEVCISERDAIACIHRYLPHLPEKVWDEISDGNGEHITEYEVDVNANGRVRLLALA